MWCLGVAACGSLFIGVNGVAGAATRRPAATPAAVPTANVKIVGFLYKPKTLTVAAGTKVIWTNNDATGHNVVFKDFASPTLGTGKSFKHQFLTAGTFKYHCSLHFEMTGKVVVTP